MKTGVIVGKFQFPFLPDDIVFNINELQFDKIVFVITISPLRNTREDPLDFNARKSVSRRIN